MSRLLLLVRHGEAVPKDVGVDDFERVLTRKGSIASKRGAEAVIHAGLRVEHLISSPADRALETAHLYGKKLGYPIEAIRIAPSLYQAGSVNSLVGEIRRLDKSVRSAAYVGHSPMLDKVAAHFVTGFAGPIQKGTAVAIRFEAATWAGVLRGSGSLIFIAENADGGKRAAVTTGRHRRPRS
jgi:phosphohistidine phosphatase